MSFLFTRSHSPLLLPCLAVPPLSLLSEHNPPPAMATADVKATPAITTPAPAPAPASSKEENKDAELARLRALCAAQQKELRDLRVKMGDPSNYHLRFRLRLCAGGAASSHLTNFMLLVCCSGRDLHLWMDVDWIGGVSRADRACVQCRWRSGDRRVCTGPHLIPRRCDAGAARAHPRAVGARQHARRGEGGRGQRRREEGVLGQLVFAPEMGMSYRFVCALAPILTLVRVLVLDSWTASLLRCRVRCGRSVST
jgi:hypothetical protein